MKNTIVYILLMLMSASSAQAGVIVVEGIFQGKDIYVQNPVGPKGVGFSVYEVQVNGEITADEINSSAFVIDLNVLRLEIGDRLEIKILHHDGSSPKVLNPEAITPTSTFEITSIQALDDEIITWTTTSESGELPYIIEQYRWNKWLKIGEVIGSGRADKNTYSFSFEPHAGTNTFRVKQKDSSGKSRYSDEVTYDAIGLSPVQFEPKKTAKDITFTRATRFEVYDEYGRLRKRGFDALIDVSSLEKGLYYLNYDNRFGETFTKK